MFLVSMLMTERLVNLPRSMLQYMVVVWTKMMALPFTRVLTHIFKHLGIDLSKEDHLAWELFLVSILKRVQLNAYFYRTLSPSIQKNHQQEKWCQEGPLPLPQPLVESTNVPSISALPKSDVSTIEDLKSRVAALEGTILVRQQQ